jgi:hypothetical protein
MPLLRIKNLPKKAKPHNCHRQRAFLSLPPTAFVRAGLATRQLHCGTKYGEMEITSQGRAGMKSSHEYLKFTYFIE